MPRKSLRTHCGNPIDLSSLPKTRPTVRFPIQTTDPYHDRQRTVRYITFTLIAGVVGTLFVASSNKFDMSPGVVLLILVMTFVVLNEHTSTWNFVVLLPLSLCWFGFLLSRFVTFHQTWPLACAVVLLFALVFRLHYQAVWIKSGWGSLLPAQRIEPQPLFRAYADAVICFCTYDTIGIPIPGAYQQRFWTQPARLGLAAIAFAVIPFTAMLFVFETIPTTKLTWHTAYLLAVPFLAPLPVLVAFTFLVSAPILGKAYACKQVDNSPYALSQCRENLHHKMVNSSDTHERQSYYCGRLRFDRTPFLVPLPVLIGGHAWICGGTKSGKTARILSLIDDLGRRPNISIVAIDLKAMSNEILATLQRVAGSRRLWYLTNRVGRSSHLFSMYHQHSWQQATSSQRANRLNKSFGLSFANVYGESFFRDGGIYGLQVASEKYPDIDAFDNHFMRLSYELSNSKEFTKQEREAAGHPRMILRRLGQQSAFNYRPTLPKSVRDNAVDLQRFFLEPTFMYVGLNAFDDPIDSTLLARLIFDELCAAGNSLSQTERETDVIVVIDEFQHILGTAVEEAAEQSRSAGCTLVMSNQSASQLARHGLDVLSTVESNTALQLWYRTGDQAGIDQLQKFGGKTTDLLRTVTYDPYGEEKSYSYTEHLLNRLEANDILASGSRQDSFIARVSVNHGYCHYNGLPFEVLDSFHVSKEEYQRRVNMPWPAPNDETLIVGDDYKTKHQNAHTPNNKPGPVIASGTLDPILKPRNGKSKGKGKKRRRK